MIRVGVSPAQYWPHRSAAYIVDFLQRALADRPGGHVAVALAGGSTPAAVYGFWTLLSPVDFDWSRVHLFLSDERMVPLDHAESNFRTAREKLSNAVHLHPVPTFQPALLAAQEYEKLIRDTVSAEPPSLAPRFDLILLGVGDDGHTASLFPGSPVLEERRALVSSAIHPRSGQKRVTFTLPLIHAARHVVFLVAGASKSGVLSRILANEGDATLPAVLAARGSQDVAWLLDDLARFGAQET